MKLSDNEIKNALERTSEEDPEGFSADILDLINRLKAENEKKSKAVVKAAQEVVDIKIELQAMRNAANSYKAEYEKLKGSKSTSLEKLPHNSLCETETGDVK